MILIRHGSIPDVGVFGTLNIGVREFKTVEQPWRDNKPFESCIPSGDYQLASHQSNKWGDTWAIVGETVSQYPSNLQRYACLFHVANWPDQVQGCIGIGDKLTYINGRLGVTNSRNSMREFLSYMTEHQETLLIEWERI